MKIGKQMGKPSEPGPRAQRGGTQAHTKRASMGGRASPRLAASYLRRSVAQPARNDHAATKMQNEVDRAYRHSSLANAEANIALSRQRASNPFVVPRGRAGQLFDSHRAETDARLNSKSRSPRLDEQGEPLPEPKAAKAAVTKLRREQWIDQVKKVGSLMQKFDEGALRLLHPDHLTWRDKSDNANIYVRNYLSSKDRADLAKFNHENELLKKTEYRQDEAGSRKPFMRQR